VVITKEELAVMEQVHAEQESAPVSRLSAAEPKINKNFAPIKLKHFRGFSLQDRWYKRKEWASIAP
jgi:hypothetical protein